MLNIVSEKSANLHQPPLSQLKNEKHGIGGSFLLTNPFSEQYAIEQTIEGDLYAVLHLWNLIKDDARVESITSSSHAFTEEKQYQRWGMQVSDHQAKRSEAE